MSISCRSILLVLLALPLLIAGCAALSPEPPPRARQAPQAPPPPSPKPAEPKAAETPGPRAVASLKLSEQARELIESKKPDQAIRIIEKAIAIDPANGYNYYYLSEAWLMKGDRKQAMEFNRLAGIYLDKDAGWIQKINRQKERIKEE